MTSKDSNSADGTLPFGAISDGAEAPRKKKVTRKKKAAPKTASKARSSDEDRAEGGEGEASPAPRKKRVSKKAVTRKASAQKGLTEESPTDGGAGDGDAPVKAPRKRRAAAKSPAAEGPAESPAEAPARAAAEAPADGGAKGSAPARDGAEDRDASSDDGEGRKRRTRRGRRRRGGEDDAGGDAGAEAGLRSEGAAERAAEGSSEEGADRDRGSVGEGRGDSRDRQDGRERDSEHRDEGQGERPGRRRRRRRRGKKNFEGDGEGRAKEGGDGAEDTSGSAPQRPAPPRTGSEDGEEGGGRSRRRRRNRNKNKDRQGDRQTDRQMGHTGDRPEGDSGGRSEAEPDAGPTTGTGMFILDKGNVSVLRQKETGYLSSKKDIYVSKKLVQKHKLRDGMMITGPVRRGYKHKLELDSVEEVDGHPPKHWDKKPTFQNLTSVDPDFHYAVGDVTDNVSMRVVDLISPIGRGQRGLLVAPPRTGKTTIMREFAAGIEKGYPDVHLMVLLIDERPEEATEWRRSVEHGEVFVSTADETSKHHIQVAEIVWKRAMRMVEMGEDVILLLDSITRLARAYNNNAGPGKTMSGGLDSRAMERPRKIFGSARNTVEAGSLTILGTTLVETGSRLDQLVFEEFKGTGNMELMLNRKLSDRRIFPAIDIEKSGTRKEEKLVGMKRLKQIHILRRVLARMHFAEAAELLISRLMDVEKTTDFLDRFSVDPED